MLYRKIPKNGDELSVLGFGCMRLPVSKDLGIDEERAVRQIHHAVDSGVNYLDTAWPYHGGKSEAFLGRALEDGYREKVKIATKLPSWMIKSRNDMDHYLDQQLDNLRTDHIDYYLLHALDGKSWDGLKELGVVDFLNRALEDGRILNPGFSFHGLIEDFKRIVDEYPWVFCQIQYNFLDQENQAGTAGLNYAASRDLGVVVMEPLRGGNIGLPEPPAAVEEIWNMAEKKRTPVEWALRWVWNHPEVTVVLSGMNEESHIEENLNIADKARSDSLTKTELEVVERAALKYQDLMKVNCTGCGYCMPCPEGVKIPESFEVYNKMHMFGDKEGAKFSYALRMSGELTDGEPGFASQCVECGECMEKCPQNIEIPMFLTSVVNELEGPDMQERTKKVKQMFKIE
ncbi:MAG: aldo/keto reductase [Desulfobulbaceae bacterium]|nr:aldo/keto reductase [Desulfobulbaceae bacterium]